MYAEPVGILHHFVSDGHHIGTVHLLSPPLQHAKAPLCAKTFRLSKKLAKAIMPKNQFLYNRSAATYVQYLHEAHRQNKHN